RWDTQKADIALRSETSILKRALEKSATAEHRIKEKMLTLQETTKRAHSLYVRKRRWSRKWRRRPAIGRERAEREEAYAQAKEEADQPREIKSEIEC
ncbi:hypothetical protein BD779DRAFT_1700596, partial [Infundibulicybe gibba]